MTRIFTRLVPTIVSKLIPQSSKFTNANLGTVFTSLRIHHLNRCVSATFPKIYRCPAVVIQSSISADREQWHAASGTAWWSYIAALAYGPLRTRTDCSPRGPVPDCRVDSEVLRHSYACTTDECGSACFFVLHNYLSLPWTFVTQCRTKTLDGLKITSSCDGFSLWHKLDRYESFSTPRDNSHGLMGWGFCLRLILLWRCFVTLFYALWFSFPIKLMKPASVSPHVAAKKVVASDSMLFMQLWRKF
jgi:hypothetical protein